MVSRRGATVLGAMVLLATAMVVRVPSIGDSDLTYHPTRQYRSALIARGLYYAETSSAPGWKRRLAAENLEGQGYIEPPLMEIATAAVYRLSEGETAWFPRLLAALFWVAGAWVLLLTARRLMPAAGAWIAAAIFLFLPFAIRSSASFQPDSLMVLCTLLAVLALVRYRAAPTAGRVWAAAGIAGLAVAVKPGIPALLLMTIFGALALDTARGRAPAAHFLIFGLLAFAPSAAYFAYGTWAEGFLRSQAGAKLIPGLWDDPAFWRGWASQVLKILTPPLAVVAAAGVLLAEPPARRLLVAGWIGYIAFGLAFTHHISTHDYYSLLMVPLAVLGAGVAIPRLVGIAARDWGIAGRVAAAVCVAIAVIPAAWQALHWGRLAPAHNQAALRHIGARVSHSSRVLVLDPAAYGGALQYEGWVGGDYWPSTGDVKFATRQGHRLAADRRQFAKTLESFQWFVVLDEAELSRQPSIRRYAERRLPLVERGPNFRIYRVVPGGAEASRSEPGPID